MVIYVGKRSNLKICIPVSVMRAKQIMLGVITFLAALAAVSGIICFVLSFQVKAVTIEAGEQISAYEITRDESAYFGREFDPDCVNHAGVYRFDVISRGENVPVRLTVRDTKAPEVTVKDIHFAIGGDVPTPEDFILSINEPDDFSGEFISEMPKMTAPGTYSAKIQFADVSGNKTRAFDVNMILIYDSVAPTINATGDIFVYIGESVAYRSVIEISDNCIGEIELIIDDSAVNTAEAGEYEARISAVDAVGNKSQTTTIKVHVMAEDEVDIKLRDKLESVIKKIIDDDMTTEQKCRAIYKYVQEKIDYAPLCYRSGQALSAYNALFVTGEGDCYSYFAASKAFFDYLGIENRAVEREAGYTEDTHFWNLVNIGDGGEERWYHFDATVMRAEYSINSCLLTDAQIEAYGEIRPHFYEYDKQKFPTVSSEIITEN